MSKTQLINNVKIKKNKGIGFKRNLQLSLMAFPALFLLLLFKYVPMFGLIIAFKDFRYDRGIFGSDWAGLKNFKFFFVSQDAFKIIANTLMINFVFIFTVIIGAAFLAILLNEVRQRVLVKTYQTVFLLPYFLSMTVVANIVYGFLDYRYGIANQVVAMFGMEPVEWYSQPQYWRTLLVIINWWKSVGYNMVIFYASVIGIDPTYYEAAEIDGATKRQIMMKVTIPLMLPIIITMLLISTGGILYADMGTFYLVPKNSSLLYDKIDVIDTYVYRALTGAGGDIGMSSAVGMFQSVTGFILVMTANFLARKYDENSALF